MIKQESHIVKGVQRDLTVSKFNPEFVFDAQNIRLTARDNNTLLSTTNERGNKELLIKTITKDTTTIQGTVIGYNVLNNYLVLFSTDNSNDLIYRLERKDDYFEAVILFQGSLGFNIEYPIESLGIYENENIQKVYWVDGKNQSRVINITTPEDIRSKWDDKAFDFSQDLKLNETISIEKLATSSGVFSPGVIQYAFTYYNIYGQESNIFNTTPLQYISFETRGASPEDKVSCCFKITINNPDNRFSYLRIYSIHRASIDATPNVLNVIDIPIGNLNKLEYTDNGTSGVSVDPTELLYIGGESIIPKTMSHKDNTLFLGNIELKNKVVSSELRDLIKKLYVSFDTKSIGSIDYPSGYYTYRNQLSMTVEHKNGQSFIENVPPITSFKYGEWYRFGLQFQYRNGKWSESVWLGDFKNNSSTPGLYESTWTIIQTVIGRVSINKDIISKAYEEGFIRVRGVVVFPSESERSIVCQGILCPTVYNIQDRYSNSPFVQSSWFSRPNSAFDINKSQDYKKYVTLNITSDIAELSLGDKYESNISPVGLPTIMAVYSISGTSVVFDILSLGGASAIPESGTMTKTEGSGPDTLEWDSASDINTSRDWSSITELGKVSDDSRAGAVTNNATSLTIFSSDDTSEQKTFDLPDYGAWAEFRHNRPIPGNKERNSEIQCIVNPAQLIVNTEKPDKSDIVEWVSRNSENFYIDQSIFTMHSPDIEFNESLSNLDATNLKLRIVGLVPITANAADIDIQTSTPPNLLFNSSDRAIGFYKEPIGSKNISLHGWKNLMAGAFWFDEISGYKEDTGNTNKYHTGFVVYPWHRNGSLNNQGTPTGDSVRTAMLSKKKISNLKFSPSTKYLRLPWYAYEEGSETKTGISGAQIFNSNEVTLLRLNEPKNSGLGTINYYGNIDKVIVPPRLGDKKDGYPIIVSGIQDTSEYAHKLFIGNFLEMGNKYTDTITGTDPISMKYKSTPHAVIALNYTNDGGQRILPTIKDGSGESEWDVNYMGTTSKVYNYWNLSKTSYISQDVIVAPNYDSYIPSGFSTISSIGFGFYWLAELYRDDVTNRFGGTTEEAFETNIWVPSGNPISLIDYSDNKEVVKDSLNVEYSEGDTYYQRYDCLKTYPYTLEDQNSVVEIVSFMCETRINIDGRYDRNRGQTSNLTMTPENFNLINKVYSQKNNFFTYRGLNYSKYSLNYFPNTVTWTKEKKMGETTDTWTNITLASTLELDGDKGEIVSLNTFNNEIYCFQKQGLSNILFNSRVQIPSSDGVPIEITNGLKVSGKRYVSNTIGCNNKWSIVESPSGLYFIDNITNSIYLFNGQISSISDRLGFRQWIGEHNSLDKWNPIEFKNFISHYDKNNDDIYFIGKDTCLVYSELLGQFTSFMSYEKVPYMFNIDSDFYAIHNGRLWEQFTGDYNIFFCPISDKDNWRNYYRPYSLTFVANSNEPYDKVFNNIEFRADSWNKNEIGEDVIINNKTFDTLEVWNEYQKGITTLTNVAGKPSPLKKKFRVWRANIPRFNTDWNGVKANNRDRIRNTWAYVKLSSNVANTDRTEFHDMMVYYSI